MSTVVKDLGAVSAYAYAVEKGYTGTEAEFAELMADYAEVGQRAEDAAESALNSKTAAQTAATTATNKASEATTAAQTATTKAGEAQTSAQTASSKASEASQSASQASGYAQTAETAKTDAQTAKTQAETARDNAVTAKTAAETAQGKAEDAQAAAESVAESIPSDYSQLSEDVSDLKEDLDEITDEVAIEYTNAVAVPSDANYWKINNNVPQLIGGKSYIIEFLPNESFTQSVIQIGTKATSASMVDTIASSVVFIANKKTSINYTPSQNGLQYIRLYQNASKFDSIQIYVKLKDSVAELQEYCNRNNILTKYLDRVDTLTQLTQTGMKTFLVYTDIHGSSENLNRIAEWHENNIKSNVADVICLGDMTVDKFSDGIEFMDTDFGNATLKVIGNHDVLANNTTPGVTALQCYNQYIAPNVADWNVTQPSDASTEGKCYYYKDYDDVRLIVLDTYFYTTAQDTWFVSVLNDALTNNKTVIIAEHEDICTASEKQPLREDYPFATKHGGFDGLQYRTVGDGGNYQTKRGHVDDFISAGGKFACWLIGHQHKDMSGYYNGTHGKQTSILSTNSSIVGSLGNKRIRGYSQDSFTYLGIDTTNSYIFVCRIGQTVDKWGHKNEYMVYDYANGTVVEYH